MGKWSFMRLLGYLLILAIASVSGNAPEVYFGDNSQMAQPKVRKLSEEIARVY
jgi:cobaltochelatase CobN